MRQFLYFLWVKIMTFFGDIMCALKPPKIRAKDIRACLAVIKPGDIICRKYTWYLDGYFIPGKYSHSGVYAGDGQIIHSMAEGILYDDIIDFIKDADGFIVLRTYVDVERMLFFARSRVGHSYDFLFDLTTKDKFYCHEFTYYCLWHGGLVINLNKRVIIADDLLSCCRHILECPS